MRVDNRKIIMYKLYEKDEVVLEEKPVIVEEEEVIEEETSFADNLTSEGIPDGVFDMFTAKKKSLSIVLNDLTIFPNKLTLMSGKKFKDHYRKQLNSIIYNSNETMNVESLIEISVLWSYVHDGLHPVQLKVKGYKKKQAEMMEVLNDFFYLNKVIIGNIHRMLRDTINTNPEALRSQ